MDLLAFLQRRLEWLYDNRSAIFWTLAATLLTAAFLIFFYAPPQSFVGPEQPIPFSHRLHAGVKAIDCRFCHPYVERSNHPGLPPVGKCLFCHNYIIPAHWWIQEEHRYFNTATPTPWVKANFLAEHVLFNHQRHIRYGFECQACHDQVASQDRIKGKQFKMGFCIDCHKQNGANLDCWLACHS